MNQNEIRAIGDRKRPELQLTGTDGNAFAVIGKVRQALRGVGWTKAEISEATDEMMSGDYDHLLRTAYNYCEVN